MVATASATTPELRSTCPCGQRQPIMQDEFLVPPGQRVIEEIRGRAATVTWLAPLLGVVRDNVQQTSMRFYRVYEYPAQYRMRTVRYAADCSLLPANLTCEVFRAVTRSSLAFVVALLNMDSPRPVALREERISTDTQAPPDILRVFFTDRSMSHNGSTIADASYAAMRFDYSRKFSFMNLLNTPELLQQTDELPLLLNSFPHRTVLLEPPDACECDFFRVSINEALHVLGLGHANHPESLLYANGPPASESPITWRVRILNTSLTHLDVYALRGVWRLNNTYAINELMQRENFMGVYRGLLFRSDPANVCRPMPAEPSKLSVRPPSPGERAPERSVELKQIVGQQPLFEQQIGDDSGEEIDKLTITMDEKETPERKRARRHLRKESQGLRILGRLKQGLLEYDPFNPVVRKALRDRLTRLVLTDDRRFAALAYDRVAQKLHDLRITNEVHSTSNLDPEFDWLANESGFSADSLMRLLVT